MNVKQRYRLTRRLATANNMSIRSGNHKLLPPPRSGPLRVSGNMMYPVESYLSLVVTLQDFVARICRTMLAYVGVPKICDTS